MGKSSLQFKAIFAYKMANWHKFDFMRIVSGHPLYLKLVLQICDCTKKIFNSCQISCYCSKKSNHSVVYVE